MFQILVNRQQVQLLQQCPEITSLIIQHQPGWPIQIPQVYTAAIKEWLYDLSQRSTSIMYNGTLINKADVNNPVTT